MYAHTARRPVGVRSAIESPAPGVSETRVRLAASLFLIPHTYACQLLNPVATTVIESTGPIESSICAPIPTSRIDAGLSLLVSRTCAAAVYMYSAAEWLLV